MANTGIKTILTLRKYVDGLPTQETKVNLSTNIDYISPSEDLSSCPVTTAAPTTAAPTTSAPTTDAPTTSVPTTAAPSCTEYFFENITSSTKNYSYTNCSGTFVSGSLTEAQGTVVCAQDGSYSVDDGIEVTNQGSC